jgi:hypothetical protein
MFGAIAWEPPKKVKTPVPADLHNEDASIVWHVTAKCDFAAAAKCKFALSGRFRVIHALG